jgi:hypothetical protein
MSGMKDDSDWAARFAQSASQVATDHDGPLSRSASSSSSATSSSLRSIQNTRNDVSTDMTYIAANGKSPMTPRRKRRRLNVPGRITRIESNIPGVNRSVVPAKPAEHVNGTVDGDVDVLEDWDVAPSAAAPVPGPMMRHDAEVGADDSDSSSAGSNEIVVKDKDGSDTDSFADIESSPMAGPTATKIQDNAERPPHHLNLSHYKTWTNQLGQNVSTNGALLPSRYKLHDDPSYPWICSVRTCRQIYGDLFGLGRHFTNSHRGQLLNDNLDGTLSIVGKYANREPGNGMLKTGGAKPALIVSTNPISADAPPPIEPCFSKRHMDKIRHRLRRSGAPQEQQQQQQQLQTHEIPTPKMPETPVPVPVMGARSVRRLVSGPIDMADRPYNMWPGMPYFHAVFYSHR